MNKSSVYWIRLPEHTDMFSEGYIGVSNDASTRWYNHKVACRCPHLKNAIKKYGWDALVKTEILIADETYCYNIEHKLRPHENIGWNVIPGGDINPMKTELGKLNHKNAVSTEEYKETQRQKTLKRIAEGFVPPKFMGEDHCRFNKICPEISERQRGSKNHMAKLVKHQGIIYGSIIEMAQALGLNYNSVKTRLKTNPTKWGYEYVT